MRHVVHPLLCVAVLAVVPSCTAEAPEAPGPDARDDDAYDLIAMAEAAGYRSWWAPRESGTTPSPAAGPHGAHVVVYVSPDLQAVAEGPPLPEGEEAWPVGAMVVCEGYDDPTTTPALLHVARRDDDGWTWAQVDADRRPLALRRPGTCTGCHAAGRDYLFSLRFPEADEE